MMLRWIVMTLVKVVFAAVLTTVLALHAAEGLEETQIVVHVGESHVEVRMDGDLFLVEDAWQDPIALTLAPGYHHLSMSRGDLVLWEEELLVRPGESQVLTVWDKNRTHGASQGRP